VAGERARCQQSLGDDNAVDGTDDTLETAQQVTSGLKPPRFCSYTGSSVPEPSASRSAQQQSCKRFNYSSDR
jgi:hypothetical protein